MYNARVQRSQCQCNHLNCLIFALASIMWKMFSYEVIVHCTRCVLGFYETRMNSCCKKHGFLDPSMVKGNVIQAIGLKLKGFIVFSLCSANKNSLYNMHSLSNPTTARPLGEHMERCSDPFVHGYNELVSETTIST